MTVYPDRLKDHFRNPRNVGEIPDADGVGQAGDPDCGDMLKVWIKVRDEHIVDIKFKCFGCPAAIASASVMTEIAKGKQLDDAAEISDETIARAIGDLPDEKLHCSNLGASGLHKAIMNYVVRSVRDAANRPG